METKMTLKSDDRIRKAYDPVVSKADIGILIEIVDDYDDMPDKAYNKDHVEKARKILEKLHDYYSA